MILPSSKTKTEKGSAPVSGAVFGVLAEHIFHPLPSYNSIHNSRNVLASWNAAAATPLSQQGHVRNPGPQFGSTWVCPAAYPCPVVLLVAGDPHQTANNAVGESDEKLPVRRLFYRARGICRHMQVWKFTLLIYLSSRIIDTA